MTKTVYIVESAAIPLFFFVFDFVFLRSAGVFARFFFSGLASSVDVCQDFGELDWQQRPGEC